MLNPRATARSNGMQVLASLYALCCHDALEDVKDNLVRPVTDAMDILFQML